MASPKVTVVEGLSGHRPFVAAHKPPITQFDPPAAHPLRRAAFLLRGVAR